MLVAVTEQGSGFRIGRAGPCSLISRSVLRDVIEKRGLILCRLRTIRSLHSGHRAWRTPDGFRDLTMRLALILELNDLRIARRSGCLACLRSEFLRLCASGVALAPC